MHTSLPKRLKDAVTDPKTNFKLTRNQNFNVSLHRPQINFIYSEQTVNNLIKKKAVKTSFIKTSNQIAANLPAAIPDILFEKCETVDSLVVR